MRITIKNGSGQREIEDMEYINSLKKKYEIKSKEFVQFFAYYFDGNSEDGVYYCPSCHTEFVSDWWIREKADYKVYKITCTYDKYGRKETEKESTEHLTDEKLEHFSAEREAYGKHIRKRYEKFLESGFTKKCPLCNSEYSYIDEKLSCDYEKYRLEDTGNPSDIPGGLEAYKKYRTKDRKYCRDPEYADGEEVYENIFEFYNNDFLYNAYEEQLIDIQDAIFNYIHNQEIVNQKKNISPETNSEVSAFLEELEETYGLDTIASADAFQGELPKDKLKSYVMNMVQLETDILSATEFLKKLMYQHHQAKRNRRKCNMDDVGELLQVYLDADTAHLEKEFDFKKALDVLTKLEQAGAADAPTGQSLPTAPEKPHAPEYKKPNIFNKKKIAEENKHLEWKYQKEMEHYHERMVKYDSDVAALKKAAEEEHTLKLQEAKQTVDAIMPELKLLEEKANQAKLAFETAKEERLAEIATIPQTAAVDFLGLKVEKAKELLENLYKTRKEMYALNIVYEKYRDLVALSAFYEYLSAGRCKTLDGEHGAYNLYEDELIADRIISQLSDVIDSLDEIAKTQRTVYSQLRSMNKTMDSLDSSMRNACKVLDTIHGTAKNIEENSKIVAFNTQETAYYAKVNANLTNALGFMVALK